MRALLAAALAFLLAAVAVAPHVHAGAPQANERCAVCVARSGDVATPNTPDVSPRTIEAGAPAGAPRLPPVCGAPLGAIPGQSPPFATA